MGLGLLLKDGIIIIIFLCCTAISAAYLLYFLHKKPLTKPSKQPTQIPHLPREIIVEILSYLSVKDIWRCKCVWKEWNTLVQDHNLATKFMQCKSRFYSHNSYYYDPEIERKGLFPKLLATCNGLDLRMDCSKRKIPFGVEWTTKLYVANEEARQRLYIPKPHVEHFGSGYGFVFVPTTGEYKVVSVFSDYGGKEKCAVLTLGGDETEHEWRFLDIMDSRFQKNDKARYLQVGMYFHCIRDDTDAYEIRSLDIHKECFTVVNFSKDFIPKGKKHWVINWNESLGFVYMDVAELNVFVLEDCEKLKWGKKFVVHMAFLGMTLDMEVDAERECRFFLALYEKRDSFEPITAKYGLLWFRRSNQHIAYDLESNKLVKTLGFKFGHRVVGGVFCHVPTVITLKGMQTVN